jgi:hypothetical protein
MSLFELFLYELRKATKREALEKKEIEAQKFEDMLNAWTR